MAHINPLLGAPQARDVDVLADKARSMLLDNMSEGVFLVNAAGHIVYANPAMETISGYTPGDLIGKRPSIFHSGVHDEAFYSTMWRELLGRGAWTGYVWNRRKDGEVSKQRLHIHTIEVASGGPVGGPVLGYQAFVRDLSVNGRGAGSAVSRSRSSFMTLLRSQLMAYPDDLCAVCMLDLDEFKEVNARYGHQTGDRVLLEVMARLRANLRDDDAVTRLSGDEFVFILPQMGGLNAISAVLTRLRSSIQDPYLVDGQTIRISAGIGVTVYPYDRAGGEDLVRHADEALARAKTNGPGSTSMYESPDAGEFSPNERIHAQIRNGMARREFCLHFQPQVDMRTGAMLGVEALLRWQHPERGMITPGAFLSRVRSNQVMIELGEWVIAEALSAIENWKRKHGVWLAVSVNMTAGQLAAPGFIRRLAGLAEQYPSAPLSCLEIEILETGALSGREEIMSAMCAAKDMGVTFSIDDFSSGSITLGDLPQMPATSIKIDQFFTQGMLGGVDDLAVIDAAVEMGARLGRRVVAEGVENEEQGVRLLERGCRHAQGYFIACPMPAEEVVGWMGRFRVPERWKNFPEVVGDRHVERSNTG